jgi:hypothetical protein
MKKIFLSFRYDDVNKRLASQVEELIESHSLSAVTGDVLGGEAVTPEVLKQVEEADGLIALLTRRDQLANGKWTTHPYCLVELQHARTNGKPTIALIEDGVDEAGPFRENEHIAFSVNEPLPAFLKLSRTIWRWKLRAGRTLKIQIIPQDVAQEIWSDRNVCNWEYRLSSGQEETAWREAKPRKEPGGLFLYVLVPDDTMLIEVRIKSPNKSWLSEATPFYMPLALTVE